MSASDCNNLESAYQSGDSTSGQVAIYGNYINFSCMKQYTECGECHRYVHRITAGEYESLKTAYLENILGRDHYWCLDSRSGYILFPPKFQDIIDKAYTDNKNVNVQLNLSYTLDPYHGTQTNNITGKVRHIIRIQKGQNTKVVYGSFLTKIPAEQSCNVEPAQFDSSVMEQGQSIDHPEQSYYAQLSVEPSQFDSSIMDQSCIYNV
jgi:hypothetical protein